MTVRDFQYWILLLGSIAVGVLLLAQIPLTHYLFVEQDKLTEFRDAAQLEPTYENLCRQLAYRMYQAGHDGDPALADLLNSEHIQVKSDAAAATNTSTNAVPEPATAAPPTPPASPEVAPAPTP